MVLERNETLLERNETHLERNETRLERNDTRLARNETRSGNLHLSGTVFPFSRIYWNSLKFLYHLSTLKCQTPRGSTSKKECERSERWRQIVYRYNVFLCSSVVLADVLEHYCSPGGEDEVSFVLDTCFLLLLV